MKILLTLYLFTISICSFSQKSQLKGHITSREDNGDFGGVTVVLIQDGKVILGAVTDMKGIYEINNIPIGVYDIKISVIGLRDKVIKDFTIYEELKTENFIFPDKCIESEKICPQGHTDNIIQIVYGYPTDRQLKKAKKGKLKLGGCVVTNCDPKWYCTVHKIEF